ncbi:hypothetical protein Tco_0434071, partial [Tanacetum coccineum]
SDEEVPIEDQPYAVADSPIALSPGYVALTSRYEVGESSTAAPRPAGDTWVDPREAAEEIAPVTLEGVNTRVTELAAVQEQDTLDIYVVIEDAQDRQTRIFQSVETLIDERQYHY